MVTPNRVSFESLKKGTTLALFVAYLMNDLGQLLIAMVSIRMVLMQLKKD